MGAVGRMKARWTWIPFLLAAGGLVGALGMAQDVEVDGRKLLVDRLWGVVLVPTPEHVRDTGVIGLHGIFLSADLEPVPAEVRDAIDPFLNQPVTLASLDAMQKAIIQAYQASAKPIRRIAFPEQDITTGVVQLVVLDDAGGS